jgi:glutathione S-transferase
VRRQLEVGAFLRSDGLIFAVAGPELGEGPIWETGAVGARLVTIPISHFCEKARWALDRAGVGYVEQRHLQLVHVIAARLAGGGNTVPVFVTETGRVLADSSDILLWADTQLEPERRLYPDGDVGAQARGLEAWLDDGLGPDGRLWMYHGTLPAVRELRRWALAGIPRWERWVFDLGGSGVEAALRRYLRIDAVAAGAALERVTRVFDEIADRLVDGRSFLVGDRFTAADLTFAALAAPVLLPERYGSPLPPPKAMPKAVSREVWRLRDHPAGTFAARLYREERVANFTGSE